MKNDPKPLENVQLYGRQVTIVEDGMCCEGFYELYIKIEKWEKMFGERLEVIRLQPISYYTLLEIKSKCPVTFRFNPL